MNENLAFQVLHPFEQFEVLLPDLTLRPLRLCSTLKSSFKFQLTVVNLAHSLINIVLGNQDSSVSIARPPTASGCGI